MNLPELSRRGFFRLTGAIAATVKGATLFSEPLIQVAESHKDWVEDCGDYYIVRIPAHKVLANEVFDKPTIFDLGEYALLGTCKVLGVANIFARGNAMIHGCDFDTSRVATLQGRAVVNLQGNGVTVYDSRFIGGPTTTIGLYVPETLKGLIVEGNTFDFPREACLIRT